MLTFCKTSNMRSTVISSNDGIHRIDIDRTSNARATIYFHDGRTSSLFAFPADSLPALDSIQALIYADIHENGGKVSTYGKWSGSNHHVLPMLDEMLDNANAFGWKGLALALESFVEANNRSQ